MMVNKKVFKNQDLGLEKLVGFIASEYKPEKIILFGSYGTEWGKENSEAEIWLKKAKEDFSFAKAGWKESKIVSVTRLISLLKK